MAAALQSPQFIQQRVAAGATFTGVSPVATAHAHVREYERGRIQKFVEGSQGGLVSFGDAAQKVYRFHYSGPGTTEVEVFLRESDHLAGVVAAGTITFVAGALYAHGETVTIPLLGRPNVVMRFATRARTGVLSRNELSVRVSPDMTAVDVRDAFKEVLRVSRVPLGGLLFESGLGATLNVYAPVVGTAWNMSIADTVADAGFTVSGLSGGVNATGHMEWRVFSAVEQSLDPEQCSYEFGNHGILVPPGYSIVVRSTGAISGGEVGEFALVLNKGWQPNVFGVSPGLGGRDE